MFVSKRCVLSWFWRVREGRVGCLFLHWIRGHWRHRREQRKKSRKYKCIPFVQVEEPQDMRHFFFNIPGVIGDAASTQESGELIKIFAAVPRNVFLFDQRAGFGVLRVRLSSLQCHGKADQRAASIRCLPDPLS